MKVQWIISVLMVSAILTFAATNTNAYYTYPITLFHGILGNDALELEVRGLVEAKQNTTYEATFRISARHLMPSVHVNALNVSLFDTGEAKYQTIVENQNLTVTGIEKTVTVTVPPRTGLVRSCFVYAHFTVDEKNYEEYVSFHLPLQVAETYYELNSEWLSKYATLKEELTNTRNLMYVFIIGTTIFIATTIYFATRKPKVKQEPSVSAFVNCMHVCDMLNV